MKTEEVVYTHYGWVLACPVMIQDPDSEDPLISARWAWLEWWLEIMLIIQGIQIGIMSYLNPYYEPAFGFLVTKEIS